MPDPVQVLGFAGSLRARSYNKAILAAATKLAPPSMTVSTFDLSAVPLFNFDVEQQGFPDVVQDLREQVAAADGVLIVSPEYNAGPAAATKNAIDWLSRNPDPPLRDKPVALAGIAGRFGTVRAQSHLRDVLLSTRSLVLARTLALSRADGMFDDDLVLVDESARSRIERHLADFAAWIEMVSPGSR